MAAKPMTEEATALLAEAVRQTNEIDDCRNRVTQLGAERREVLAALREHGVTYKVIAVATGLHSITLQQTMKRWRDENPIHMWEGFTKNTATALKERAAADAG